MNRILLFVSGGLLIIGVLFFLFFSSKPLIKLPGGLLVLRSKMLRGLIKNSQKIVLESELSDYGLVIGNYNAIDLFLKDKNSDLRLKVVLVEMKSNLSHVIKTEGKVYGYYNVSLVSDGSQLIVSVSPTIDGLNELKTLSRGVSFA